MAQKEDPVHASPTKRFFVEMLTRDIDLDDAILDLLDNCVDGIQRSKKIDADDDEAYNDFWAKIHLSATAFTIEDNCGGIDRETALKYAFMMGRPDDAPDEHLPTVGMYGIGMKRAIFKIGQHATVTSHTKDEAFEVEIKPDWLTDDRNWKLPLNELANGSGVHGTKVHVTKLLPSIKHSFTDTAFEETLRAKIASHYSFIMHKGFTVEVNKIAVTASPLRFLFEDPSGDKETLAPFMARGTKGGVKFEVAVGFNDPTPTADDEEDEQEAKRTKDSAGWTIICNDRVVVYCDKTRLTGWGEADVPSFHSQFNAITGVVQFRTTDALKLPVTTTKRGIDAGSDLFLYVKNRMREGTKMFTDYTNRWKTKRRSERTHEDSAKPLGLKELRSVIPATAWKKVKDTDDEQKFVPSLPRPKDTSGVKIMRFSKPLTAIKRVSKFLFDEDRRPSEVAEACFDRVHKEAKK